MKITIRPARAKDLEAIHGLIKTYAKEKRLIARSAAEIKKTLKNFFLAEIKCKGQAIAIGCAALEIYSSKLAEVRSLAVHPDYKGVGAGRALVKACVERAHKRRVLEVVEGRTKADACQLIDPTLQRHGDHQPREGRVH